MRNTVDPDIFVAVNVCKFEFNINFAAESLQFWSTDPETLHAGSQYSM